MNALGTDYFLVLFKFVPPVERTLDKKRSKDQRIWKLEQIIYKSEA